MGFAEGSSLQKGHNNDLSLFSIRPLRGFVKKIGHAASKPLESEMHFLQGFSSSYQSFWQTKAKPF